MSGTTWFLVALAGTFFGIGIGCVGVAARDANPDPWWWGIDCQAVAAVIFWAGVLPGLPS
jgi:hypothetical protein